MVKQVDRDAGEANDEKEDEDLEECKNFEASLIKQMFKKVKVVKDVIEDVTEDVIKEVVLEEDNKDVEFVEVAKFAEFAEVVKDGEDVAKEVADKVP